jgi:hypothetical protein
VCGDELKLLSANQNLCAKLPLPASKSGDAIRENPEALAGSPWAPRRTKQVRNRTSFSYLGAVVRRGPTARLQGPPADEVRRSASGSGCGGPAELPDAHGGSVWAHKSKEALQGCSGKVRAAVAGGKATLPVPMAPSKILQNAHPNIYNTAPIIYI